MKIWNVASNGLSHYEVMRNKVVSAPLRILLIRITCIMEHKYLISKRNLTSAADLVNMTHQIGWIVVNTYRAGVAQFVRPVSAAEEANPKRSTACRR